MRDAAIAAHQVFARGQAVVEGYLVQFFITRLLGGIKDDSYIHHDVDEQAGGSQERTQVASMRLVAQCQGAPGFDNHLVDM